MRTPRYPRISLRMVFEAIAVAAEAKVIAGERDRRLVVHRMYAHATAVIGASTGAPAEAHAIADFGDRDDGVLAGRHRGAEAVRRARPLGDLREFLYCFGGVHGRPRIHLRRIRSGVAAVMAA
ncbi:MAG: hypothetical protein O3B31_01620 [Chloroflexi bacterium]|nr:hypothetical protein [Chloroflexota bacterium]